MALSLDLAACEAKIARAAVHLESLKRECKIAFDQRQPYSLRMYQIEPNSPWYGISYKAADFKEFGLGVIVGDIVHNMRSALDYIVSTLVEASGHKVGNKHQFPIFSDRNEYIKRVGTATRALAKSPIRGVRFGLQEIWQVQPFHKNPEPELDPLAVIHRFSNADKHRMILAYVPAFRQSSGKIYSTVPAVERVINPTIPDYWEPGRENEICRVRFASVPEEQPRCEAEVTVTVHFAAPGNISPGKTMLAVDASKLDDALKHVAMVVDLFKAL